MANSIKLKNNNYIDSTGVVHNREKLSDILVNIFNAINDSGKKTPNFINNWSSKSFNPCYYRKVGNIVYIYGVIGGGNGSDIFTLPAGYRPVKPYCSFVCRNDTGTCRILVNDNGVVTYENINGNGNEVSLYGISFFVN